MKTQISNGRGKPPPTPQTLGLNREEPFREKLDEWISTESSRLNVNISPEMAAIMLERNWERTPERDEGNRRLRQKVVDKFARAMDTGDWMVTGQPIVFSKEGILNDGQHRLWACVMSEKSFVCDLRFGIERQSFRGTDRGRTRTAADMLQIEGHANAAVTAASIVWLIRYDLGLPSAAYISFEPYEILDELEARKAIEYSVQHRAKAGKIASPAVMVAAHYLCARVNREKADEFFNLIGSGVGIEASNDPVILLRDRLIRNRGSRRPMKPVEVFALVLKAWHFWLTDTPVKSLRWNLSEDFPTKGLRKQQIGDKDKP